MRTSQNSLSGVPTLHCERTGRSMLLLLRKRARLRHSFNRSTVVSQSVKESSRSWSGAGVGATAHSLSCLLALSF